ncbi:MAG: hypothetical protein V3S32_12460 [Acidimicrobiia bacterium]
MKPYPELSTSTNLPRISLEMEIPLSRNDAMDYVIVLDRWLEADADAILGAEYERLPVLA